ncbi:hypothetical protein EJ07DRAFT_160029 [Lizonia empirigonia]|nr:hypothetical protein EJ07DRAFT_160029 [Lizonia empirigonia]
MGHGWDSRTEAMYQNPQRHNPHNPAPTPVSSYLKIQAHCPSSKTHNKVRSKQHAVSSKASLVSSEPSCSICSYARRVGRSACVGCLPHSPTSPPSQHISKPANVRIQYEPHHVRASVLHLVKDSVCNNTEFYATLESLLKTTESEKMVPMRSNNTGVVLLAGDFGKEVPAIRLEPADGAAPTMDLSTCITLATPDWKDDEVFICTELDIRPKYRKSSKCEACVQAAWMNAGARMMLGGLTEQEEKELERQFD